MSIVINSCRSHQTWPSYHLVYEWEDEIAKLIPDAYIKPESIQYRFIRRFIEHYHIKPIAINNKIHLNYVLGANAKLNIYNRENVVPIIIDYFLKDSDIKSFEDAYKHNPLVLISSREVYEYLMDKKVELPIEHWALSLPDKYKINEKSSFVKKYDFVLVGRQSPIMRKWLDMYIKKYPETTFVSECEDRKLYYKANDGEVLGKYDTRESYISLVEKSRMALYVTPGMDGSRSNTNNFNQVTPKFLEYIRCGCQLLLRYVDNPDTRFYELNSFCPSLNSYEEFESRVNLYKTENPDIKVYSEYLKKHYTSSRILQLKSLMQKYKLL